MAASLDFARALVVDAIDTTGKIRENVAHLRVLGKTAIAGGKAAIDHVRKGAERALEQVADGIEASSRQWQRTHGARGGRR